MQRGRARPFGLLCCSFALLLWLSLPVIASLHSKAGGSDRVEGQGCAVSGKTGSLDVARVKSEGGVGLPSRRRQATRPTCSLRSTPLVLLMTLALSRGWDCWRVAARPAHDYVRQYRR